MKVNMKSVGKIDRSVFFVLQIYNISIYVDTGKQKQMFPPSDSRQLSPNSEGGL